MHSPTKITFRSTLNPVRLKGFRLLTHTTTAPPKQLNVQSISEWCFPEDSYVNDAFDKLIQQVGKKDLLDDLKNIDYEAKCDALAERKQVDGLLVPLQIEALALAKELREFADELGPCPEIPNTGTLTPGTPEHDAALKGMAGAGEARERWDNNLYHGYANRDFGKKISSIFHRAGEKYGLEYPLDMLARSARNWAIIYLVWHYEGRAGNGSDSYVDKS